MNLTDPRRIPFGVFSDPEIYAREQARIYRGPTWNFVALEAEIPAPHDFKSTFVGDTPVVITRDAAGELHGWVNRCAHKGALVCREPHGNAETHTCVYHQWSYDCTGALQGVPFMRGLTRGESRMTGMPPGFDRQDHGLERLRIDAYRGLVFATFDAALMPLAGYLGPAMRARIDRLFHKPIEFLGVTRQYSRSNWKLYVENARDQYHATLLHLFHTTFNIARVNMRVQCSNDGPDSMHSCLLAIRDGDQGAKEYEREQIRSYAADVKLNDPSLLDMRLEFDLETTNHIQSIFPSLVIQQIHNTLACRQVLPKGTDHFELVFHFFGYSDDDPELRRMRIRQVNFVGPAGYISMEDTEATELVQRGIAGSTRAHSVIDMCKSAPEGEDSMISEHFVRTFWRAYSSLMRD